MKHNIIIALKKLSKLMFIILLFISIWFIYKVLKLNIIPSKYLFIGLPIYFVILIIMGVLIFVKKINILIKIFSGIFSIIIIGLVFYVNNYIVHTEDFINKIKEKDYILRSYYVVSLSDNKYKNVSDFDSLGIYNLDEDYNNALDQLTTQFNLSLNTYDSFEDANKALFNKEESIILLSSTDRGILIDKIEHYEEKTTIISTVYVKKENDVVTVEYEVTEKPFNIFISGIDVSGDISTVSRSDVNMVVTVNPSTHEILLTSIPRDYYVELSGKGAKDKLTHAGVYGINTSVNTVENLLSIDIQYYLKVNFSTLIEVVDLIGGIDVYSSYPFTTYNDKNCHIVEGNNSLDGKCALAFSRERYAYKEGDRQRIRNQQDVLIAILNKTITSKELLEKYFEILEIMGKSFQTNMSKEKIYQLINMQLNNMQPWTIDTYCLDGSNSYDYTYSYSGGKLYVMEPNMSTVNKANKKINDLLNK